PAPHPATPSANTTTKRTTPDPTSRGKTFKFKLRGQVDGVEAAGAMAELHRDVVEAQAAEVRDVFGGGVRG
ncbi:hypothetical protein ACFQ79_32425, partial [Streptomyces sp. NPDC056480]